MGARKTTTSDLPKGVEIRKHRNGGESLRINFSFKRQAYRKALALKPTKTNILYASKLLTDIRLAIATNTFALEDFFPEEAYKGQYDNLLIDLVEERMDRKLMLGEQGSANGWEKSTYSDRKKKLDNWIKPHFSDLSVKDVSASHVREFLKAASGVLSSHTASMVLSIINPIFEEALGDGEIARHPFSHLKLGDYLHTRSTAERKKEIDPLDEHEMYAMMQPENYSHSCDADFFTFCLMSGVRRQEAPRVKWSNIDWNRRKLKLDEAVGTTDNQEYVKGLKTGEERTIDILPDAWEAIMRQRERTQMKGDYIFLNPTTSKPYSAQTLYHKWRNACRKSGIRYRPVKQTRHTFVSVMLALGTNPSWIKNQSGHTSTAMFDKHYAKWVEIGQQFFQETTMEEVLKAAAERKAMGIE